MTIKFTNDTVRTLPAKGSDTLYPDRDPRNGVPGLYLRVRAGGSRTFIIQWRQGEFQRRSTIGKVGVLSLDEARKAARKAIVGIDAGHDPVAAKAKARVSDKQIFLKLALEYLDDRARDMRSSSLAMCKLHIEKYWKPLHRLPVGKIDRALIASELRTIVKERGAVSADRARSTLSAFYGWCIDEGVVAVNPVKDTRKASKNANRYRVLTDAELVAIWNAAPANDYGRIVKLLMLTGQRRDEIGELKWAEISDEGDMIFLPSSRTKNSRPHDVPLSPIARSVLDERPLEIDGRDQVFGRGQAGYSGFSKAKERLDKAAGATGWTLHDLRRTTATRMADLGIAPHIIEAVLNHVSGHKAGVAGVYNRSSYSAEKRAALELWGMHIQTLLAKADGANVAKLRA
jgi:integrase